MRVLIERHTVTMYPVEKEAVVTWKQTRVLYHLNHVTSGRQLWSHKSITVLQQRFIAFVFDFDYKLFTSYQFQGYWGQEALM